MPWSPGDDAITYSLGLDSAYYPNKHFPFVRKPASPQRISRSGLERARPGLTAAGKASVHLGHFTRVYAGFPASVTLWAGANSASAVPVQPIDISKNTSDETSVFRMLLRPVGLPPSKLLGT